MKKVSVLVLAMLMGTQAFCGDTWIDRQKARPAAKRLEMSQNLILLGAVLTIGGIVMSKQAGDIYSRSKSTRPHAGAHAASKGSWYNFGATVAGVAGLGCLGVGVRLRFTL
jgi:hypothetical protein